MKVIQEHVCFGGTLKIVAHDSVALGCEMVFSIFLPPHAKTLPYPSLMFLSGLTCTHENFTTKAGAYKKAAELGLIIIAPDTSPRGGDIPDDAESYDFGKGAGFYINATQQPWANHYQMERYIAEELPAFLAKEFPVSLDTMGICGHSMGGHGALTLYMKYPHLFKSASAFAPIVAPSQVPWGEKAFSRYLGDDQNEWARHDACALVGGADINRALPILIDQGTGDQFLDEQLKPILFEAACKDAGQALTLNMREGYDHSYYFIQSFIDDHLEHHAAALSA